MESLIEYIIEHLLAVVFFVAALSYTYFLIYGLGDYMQAVNTKKELQNKITYEQTIDISRKEVVSSGELISYLMRELDYDTTVNGNLLKKGEYAYQTYSFYTIGAKKFKKNYEYDDSGNIKKVVFQTIY